MERLKIWKAEEQQISFLKREPAVLLLQSYAASGIMLNWSTELAYLGKIN